MPRGKKALASNAKAKAKKPPRRATGAKAAAKAAKRPAKKVAKAQTAPVRPRQLGLGATTPYYGQIASFPYNFAPTGWMACTGQVLPISRYVALFSLLSTTYGGNGTTTFMLPNLPPRGPSGPWHYIAIDGVYPPRN